MDNKAQPNKRKYLSFTGIAKGPMELAGHNAAASPSSTPSRRVPGATGTAPRNAAGTGVAAPPGLALSGHAPEATRPASLNASGPNATALPGSMPSGHAPEATGTAIRNVSGTSAPIGQDLQELQTRVADLTQQSRKTRNILSTISKSLGEHQQRISVLEHPRLLDPTHRGTGQNIEPAPVTFPPGRAPVVRFSHGPPMDFSSGPPMGSSHGLSMSLSLGSPIGFPHGSSMGLSLGGPVGFSHGLHNVQTTGMRGGVPRGGNESSGPPHLPTQNVGARSNTNLNATQGQLASIARQTASANDVASSSGAPESRVFPGLGQVDLSNPSELKVFKSMLGKAFILDLFRSTDKDDGCTMYTVQSFPNFNKLLCRQRGEETRIFEHSQQSVWSEVPAVLELDTRKPTSAVLAFPRYVLDLGEVFVWKRCAETGQKQQRSSGFHLVMDVARPAKPLWLVYRYHERYPDLEHHLDLNTAYKRDPVWHPFAAAAGIEFDSALVFTSAARWKGELKYDGFAAVVDLVKGTGRVRKPTFVEPVLEEVKQEIAKGWA
ncbi:hypothetical protein DL764_009513 [Monosporascus ibericus]|uniref:Uncharacterized protein n=1 Tax=Monosporascus ibericus TaxID=155417 RepID=A0A4Q4SUU9_9PEZI|nr:hypothetical protein DL764_009513 [Monosporascus ibericus]